MSVFHLVDCRDEKIESVKAWISPEDAECGITVNFESIRIHLTSSQLEEIANAWKEDKEEAMSNLSQHLLGKRSTFNGPEKN